jgi:hypothetical protein
MTESPQQPRERPAEAAWRALDQHFSAARAPHGLDERVQRSLDAARASQRRPLLLSFAAGMVAAALVLAAVWPASPPVNNGPLVHGGLVGPSYALRDGDGKGLQVLESASFVSAYRAELGLIASQGTRLDSKPGGVDVYQGDVSFSVAKVRDPKHPIFIGVSAGKIEIVGTRFRVVEYGDHGYVDVTEGKVRFHSREGQTVRIATGQRFVWQVGAPAQKPVLAPLEPAPEVVRIEPPLPRTEPQVRPPPTARPASDKKAMESPLSQGRNTQHVEAHEAPAPSAQPGSSTGNVRRMLEIQSLRSKHRYAEALQQVERWLTAEDDSAMRQLLLQELEDLRVRQRCHEDPNCGQDE